MKIKNAELMKSARESLRGKWGIAVSGFLIYCILSFSLGAIPIIGPIIALIIGGPLTLGLAIFSLAIARRSDVRIELIFEGFQDFSRALVAYLLVAIFILLWLLLLIIPGIIAAFSYALTFYIMADDKSISARDAISKSKKMMNGYKWKLFCLYLRFIGWFILGILSLFIGFLWIGPYLQISVAKFYEDVKANYEATVNQ